MINGKGERGGADDLVGAPMDTIIAPNIYIYIYIYIYSYI